MLTLEVVILALAVLGFALLALGVMELLWPTRPRRRRPRASPPAEPAGAGPGPRLGRREPPTPVRASGPPAAAARLPRPGAARPATVGHEPVPSEESVDVEPPIERILRAQVEAPERPAPRGERLPPVTPPAPSPVAEDARVAEPPESPVCSVTTGAEAQAPLEPPAEPGPATERVPASAAAEVASPVERLTRLWEAGRFAEVVSEGTTILGAGVPAAGERARLWGLVGLARQALGEPEGARAALEEALSAAPPSDRPTWQRYLAGLALGMGQALLDRAGAGQVEAPDERVATIRSAAQWLEGGLAASPEDADLRQALGVAREMLWAAYDQATSTLMERHAYQDARRLLREALADAECPPELQSTFRDRLAATFAAEIGQLTAEAIRRMQEGSEEEALDALERAEGLFSTVPAEGLPPRRRQELERRLWWSYTKLGIRRVDAERWEEALPPLLHALGFQGVGPERHDETRRPLVRALEGLVDARVPLLRRRLDEGDRDGAAAEAEWLWGLLQSALDRGVSRQDLARALSRAQPLFERIGRRPPA